MKTIGVIGWKNSGKTTLVSKLVNYFSSLNLKVGVIKHAHHSFDIDHPNTDSYKIRKSGAFKTTIVSNKRLAVIEERADDNEIDLKSIIDMNKDCQILILEGFKKNNDIPKIEVFLKKNKKEYLYKNVEKVNLLVTDDDKSHPLKVLSHDQIPLIAKFIQDA
ncbi:MAG: molybdopterin-guanine dinucleotide biosynthesis protein B [alpha proteobacterium HIMB59]|nr:MAG: molybdopterin-guanine dinucleotide biosynthesis protein B [alpha proteobacterium HIMB59]